MFAGTCLQREEVVPAEWEPPAGSSQPDGARRGAGCPQAAPIFGVGAPPFGASATTGGITCQLTGLWQGWSRRPGTEFALGSHKHLAASSCWAHGAEGMAGQVQEPAFGQRCSRVQVLSFPLLFVCFFLFLSKLFFSANPQKQPKK